MFNQILWATDGSDNAERALETARSLAREEGATLTIVHVVQRLAIAKGIKWNADEENVVERISDTAEQLSAAGLNVSLKIVNAVGIQPANVIADVGRRVGADVIVIGTRGHSALGGLLMGSVTQRLLHYADCPILAVPPATDAAGETSATREEAAIYLG